jgi:methylated-DNA-[protein]-cysteine S-methyltransferase
LSCRSIGRARHFRRKLCRIPYGKTCSYKDVAVRLKSPKAVRAVGGANGKNPLCIIAPCHRVIAADGGLGGYTGGLEIKRFLLDLESRGLKPH